jgi:excisionase family DNA binding protein
MTRPDPELETKLTYNVGEAARALGVSKSQIYSKIAVGELRSFRVFGRVVVTADTLRQVVAAALAAADDNLDAA